jgi:hypothetical protein
VKVWNLRCELGHTFEGWFGSEDDFQSQTARGLLTCPVCGVPEVSRMPSAPRLNLGHTQTTPEERVPAAPEPASSGAPNPAQAALARLVQHALAHTEDVGERFAEEARRIHYGEAEERGIRGQASAEERESLAEEGIEVVSLPLPWVPKGPVQ